MNCRVLIVSCALVSCLAVPSHGDVLEGVLLVTYRNLLLIATPVNGEQVILLPDAVSYKHFNSLQDLTKGSRLRIDAVRTLPGVTVADSLELMSGVPISSDTVISPSDVWSRIVSGKRMVLLDIRPDEHFNRGHLPGVHSLSQPSNPSNLKDILEGLKPAGETPIIIYSSDDSDTRLSEVGKLVLSLGYTNVRILATGMTGWLKDGHGVMVPVDHIKKLMSERKPLLLIDTRDRNLYMAGHIPGALNVSSSRLHPDTVMPYDAADPILFYGADGNDREPLDAAQKVASWGYLQKSDAPVMILEGGVAAWRGAGLQLEKGEAEKAVPSAPTATRGIVLFEEFRQRWDKRGSDAAVRFLDVRSRLELVDAKIENTVHIPVDELPFRLAELPKDKEILVYCSSGRRSRIAYTILRQNGYRTRYLGRMLSVSTNGEIN